MEQIDEPLRLHGFTLSWIPGAGEKGAITVTCRLSHVAGHHIETTLSAPPEQSGSKNSVQAVGSTVSYLQRYTALSLLGLTTADMPDADDEPHDSAPAQDDSARVDSARNMAAVEKLRKHGKTVEQAQEFLGKTIAGWTVADLGKLQAWAKGAA